MSDERFHWYQQPVPTGEYSFMQLASLVDDVVTAAQRWVDVYGVGPFYVLPARGPATVTYRGETTELELKIAVSQAGPLQIELIEQVSDGPSVYRDVYGPGESGLHHLCTVAKDYDEAVAHYTGLGFEFVAEQDAPGIGRVGYVDTVDDFGFITEIVEWSEPFLTLLSKTARVCATWDGSDPVRLMRPTGGYDVPEASPSAT